MSKTFKVNRSGFEDRFINFRPTPFLPYVRFRSPPAQESSVLGFRCARAKSGGSFRVIRGGGWGGGAADCRAAIRRYNAPVNRFNYLGFRLVRRKE